jgi:hypothetical protein
MGLRFLREGHVGPEVDGKELYALGAVGQPVSTQERNGVQSRGWWSLGKVNTRH